MLLLPVSDFHLRRNPFACCQQYGSPFGGRLLQMSPSAVALLHVAGREIEVLMDYAPELICTRKVSGWQGRHWNGSGLRVRYASLGGGGSTS
jgi:hypothetical protein